MECGKTNEPTCLMHSNICVDQIITIKEKNVLFIVFNDEIKLYNINDIYANNCLCSIKKYCDINDYDYFFKINDELFINNHLKLLKIEYDSNNNPIKMDFINNYIDEKIKKKLFGSFICQICIKYLYANIDEEKFITLENYCGRGDPCYHNLYMISRNENNDLILEKEVELKLPNKYWCCCACDDVGKLFFGLWAAS